jgi:hypothetical protein
MMKRAERKATEDEIAAKYRDLSILQVRARRLASEEAATGVVAVVRFSVRNAWSTITCDGPPCCPNGWFLETTEGEYVVLDSWHFLSATADRRFPGTIVDIVLWPRSNRVVAATATGDPVVASDLVPESLARLDSQRGECVVYSWDDLPEEARAELNTV